ALSSFLKFRLDAREHLSRSLAADPEFGLAHCLKGYFAMLLYKQAGVAPAAQAARNAGPRVDKATGVEQSQVEALDAWAAGDLDRTLAIWEAILADHPTDTLALRLAHLKYFWLGRPRDMRASVERVVTRWSRDLPGWGAVLSCRCFAHEECGDYATAEAAARPSSSIPPICGRRTRLPMSWRCKIDTTKASPGSASSSDIGPAPITCCITCGGTARCSISSGASSTWFSTSTIAVFATSTRRWRKCNPTSISTSRMPHRCSSGWSATMCPSAIAGSSLPTRLKSASAIAGRRSRCRIG